MLINLLDNAVKFTELGTVTLRLNCRSVDGGHPRLLTFEVEDTGAGIASEDQSRIFDPFVQAAGKPRNQKGTGLGLRISRQFVELMGGTIQLESTSGRGSTFRVEVPVEQAEEFEVDPSQDRGKRIVGVNPGRPDHRVLVVEDQDENWLLLQRLMESSGFQVRLAQNGLQAVELFQSWQPGFIWMDIGMPVMDGTEAIGGSEL